MSTLEKAFIKLNFREIDPEKDIDWSNSIYAQKVAKVRAEFVPPGTEFQPVEMKDGHLETSEPRIAGEDGGVIVTNPSGVSYLLSVTRFKERYCQRPDEKGFHTPTYDPIEMTFVDEGVRFVHELDGSLQLKPGGAILRHSSGELHVLQPEEMDTYAFIVGAGFSNSTAREAARKHGMRIPASFEDRPQPSREPVFG